MSDLALGAVWLAVLLTGIAGCVVAHAIGLASTYVRDALHIGAAVWIVGWPRWGSPFVPIAIVVVVAATTAVLPLAARRIRWAELVVRSVTNHDEHWTGLIHYTLAYATLTAIGLVGAPFPAAVALFALSLGDGLGGAVGRKLGVHGYRIGAAKRKSLEGSLTVAIAAGFGAWIAAQLFAVPIGVGAVALLGGVAAAAEAAAPRGTDNLLVPLAVWITALAIT